MVARYGAIWYQLTFNFCRVVSDRKGTMVKGMPVETVWMGRFSSSSATGRPSTLATTSCGCVAPNCGSA